MKRILLVSLVLLSINAIAQKATLNETSVNYLGKAYRVGDVVHLGYGSNSNKDFSFINYGTSVGGINVPGLYRKAKVDWSKADLEIEKIEKKSGVVWLRCKPIGKGTSVGSMLGGKIYINLEGAVDNKELTGVEPGKTEAGTNAPNSSNRQTVTAPSPVNKKLNKLK